MTVFFIRFLWLFSALFLASCANLSSSQTSGSSQPPGQSPTGGPPWALPPGAANPNITSSQPDIAIPVQGLAGAWSGGRLANKLTPDIRAKMIDLTQDALSRGQSGKTIAWTDGALRGTIVPQVAFAGPSDLQCREFHQTLRSSDTVETGYATACQTRDGTWRILAE